MFIVSISMLLTYQVDIVVQKITKENSERQTFLMHHVLAHVNPGVRNKILRYKDENDACGDSPSRSWKGVQCTDGLVTTFCYDPGEWEVPSIGNFSIEWLPHSVQCLDLSFARQFYGINTRLLPKDSRVINLMRNDIFGPVDLQRLPLRMQNFNMSGNKITGPIDLTVLPEFLEYLDLSYNHIVQDAVQIANLPPNLKLIAIEGPAGKDNIMAIHTTVHERRRVKRLLQKKIPVQCYV